MVDRIRKETFTLPTSGATVTYAISDMEGLTPIAARFRAVFEDDLGIQQSDSSIMQGACTSTGDYCVATHAPDADAGFSSGSIGVTDRCVYLLKGDGSSSECELSLDSFAPDSVVLTVDKASSVADLHVEVTLISCASADLVSFTTAAGFLGTVNIPVTDTPHVMEFLFQPQAWVSSGSATVSADAEWGYALADYDGSFTQGGHWRFALDGGYGGRQSNVARIVDTTLMVRRVYIDGASGSGVEDSSCALFSITSSFVTIYTFHPGSLYGVMLALHFESGLDYGIGLTKSKTSTGEALTVTPAKPQFASWFATYLTSNTTPSTGNTSGTFSFGGVDIDGRGKTLGSREQDNRATSSISKSWAVDSAYAMRQNNGPVDIQADFVAMESGGIRLDWTNIAASGRYYLFWWIEDFPYTASLPLAISTRLGVASPDALMGSATPDALAGVATPEALAGLAGPSAHMGTATPDASMGNA